MRQIVLGIILVLHASAAFGQASFQFATVGLNAPDDPNVSGFRFSVLHGENRSVSGLDVGLLSVSETARLSGASFVFGIGVVTEEMDGAAAFSLVNVHRSTDRGLNAAFVNFVKDTPDAVTIGFLNIAEGATMVDIGGVNVSDRSKVQLGFINVTNEITGLQLGFVNIAENGFLPVFPFFNFPGD